MQAILHAAPRQENGNKPKVGDGLLLPNGEAELARVGAAFRGHLPKQIRPRTTVVQQRLCLVPSHEPVVEATQVQSHSNTTAHTQPNEPTCRLHALMHSSKQVRVQDVYVLLCAVVANMNEASSSRGRLGMFGCGGWNDCDEIAMRLCGHYCVSVCLCVFEGAERGGAGPSRGRSGGGV